MLPILIVEYFLYTHGVGSPQIRLIALLLGFPGLYLGVQGIDPGGFLCARCLESAVVQRGQHLSTVDMIANLHLDRGYAPVAFGHHVGLLLHNQGPDGGEVAPFAACRGGGTRLRGCFSGRGRGSQNRRRR